MTSQGFACVDCAHDHQGQRLAYICIGCPCGRRSADPVRAVTARELIDQRVADLRKRGFGGSFVEPFLTLAGALGELELTDQTEPFFDWFLNWDSGVLLGLAHLLMDFEQRRAS